MKETIKAGIGGYAFTFDVDAYQALNTYLENLKEYFRDKEDGQEILIDIESRMSELLQLKAKSANDIITLSDAENIMEIMGNPIDFADGDENQIKNDQPSGKKKENPLFEKKLYRDMDHSVLGGVCSGLGQYFRIDPVIIRIVYTLSVILSNQISHRFSMFLFLTYFVLWIAMPKAKTIVQKISMTGQNPSIEGIETGDLKYQEIRGSGLGRTLGKIMKVFCGIILYMIGIGIALSAFFILFFPSILDLPSIKEFLESNALYTSDIIISGTISWLAPAFMVIYFAIRLMTKITARDFVILGITFAIWIMACTYLGVLGSKVAMDYKNQASYNDKFIPAIQPDTLHIRLDDEFKYAETVFDSNQLYMIDGSPKSWFIIPSIEVRKDSIYKEIEIEVIKRAFAKNRNTAEEKAKNATLEFQGQSNSLTIKPHLYNRHNLWDREIFSITVYCPENKTVVVDGPLQRRSHWHFITD